MTNDRERMAGGQDADAEREGRVGRMMPIDPGTGAGGTTGQPEHSDVASGGSGPTEWGGGVVATGRAGVVDPDADDLPLHEVRNDVRDPGEAYGADRGMAGTDR